MGIKEFLRSGKIAIAREGVKKQLSMAARLSKLLKSIGANQGVVMCTGGLALDKGLIAALEEDIAQIKDMKCVVRSHADAIFAGAIGAALWGAYRFDKLAAQGRVPKAA